MGFDRQRFFYLAIFRVTTMNFILYMLVFSIARVCVCKKICCYNPDNNGEDTMINPFWIIMLLCTWMKCNATKQYFMTTLSFWVYLSSSRIFAGPSISLESISVASWKFFSYQKYCYSAFLIKSFQRYLFSGVFLLLFLTFMWHLQPYYISSISAFFSFWQHLEKEYFCRPSREIWKKLSLLPSTLQCRRCDILRTLF